MAPPGQRVEALNLAAEFVADVALKDLGSVGVAVGVLGLQGRADDVGDSHRHGKPLSDVGELSAYC